MNALDCVECFVGGPCDGMRRSGTRDLDFPIFIGRELTVADEPQTAVYEYTGHQESHGCTERLYRFFELMTPDEGRAFLTDHGDLTGFSRLRG